MSSPAATTPTTAKKPAPTPLILPADRSGLQPSPASAEDLLSPTGAPAPSPGNLIASSDESARTVYLLT